MFTVESTMAGVMIRFPIYIFSLRLTECRSEADESFFVWAGLFYLHPGLG